MHLDFDKIGKIGPIATSAPLGSWKKSPVAECTVDKEVQSYPQEYHQREMCASLCGKEATQQARARSQHSLDGLRDAQDMLCCSHWTCCWTSCAAPTPHALDDQGGVDENHKSD